MWQNKNQSEMTEERVETKDRTKINNKWSRVESNGERWNWKEWGEGEAAKYTESKTAWDHLRSWNKGNRCKFPLPPLNYLSGKASSVYLCISVFYISENPRNHIRLRGSVTVHHYPCISFPSYVIPSFPVLSSLNSPTNLATYVFSTNHSNTCHDDSKTEEMPQALLFITELKIWKSSSFHCLSLFWAPSLIHIVYTHSISLYFNFV